MLDNGALPGRRSFLNRFACGCLMAAAGRSAFAADAPKTTVTADQALAKLKRGNDDFVHDRHGPPAINHIKLLEISAAQSPFAVLIGCSDSRVAPELLFGSGLGELFVVRVAGNSVDRTALGTVEYGVAELGCRLVVVLGHERCGAVQAAVSVVTEDMQFPGAIGEMVAPIIPAVLMAQRMPGNLVVNAVKENVRRVARRLSQGDAIMSEPVRAGKVKIVPAYYSLSDGTVEFL
jgi:carbonic anhydrase